MTAPHRKREHQLDEIQTFNEPGLHVSCDSCMCDLTHSVRMKCADPVCEPGDGVDICPACFCAGKEFAKHRRGHAYRVIELLSYPIFSEDWGADEELLLIEGISKAGFGNWKMIAEHVGTRTKEELEEHYNSVYVDSPDWPLPRMDADFDIDPEEFQQRKRRRMSAMNNAAPPPPKVAPTSALGVHEVATFLPGCLEFERYDRVGELTALDEAIALARQALGLRPFGHPLRSTSLHNLANCFFTRYRRLGEMTDLEEAIVLVRQALDLRLPGHPLRSSSLNNLTDHLSIRYNQLALMKDLDELITLDREALGLFLPGHPRRSNSLQSLAYRLHTRFTHLRKIEDREELFSLYTQLEHIPQTVSSNDLSVAKAWIETAEDFQHPTMLLAYETFLRLLIQYLASLPSLPQDLVVLKKLTSSLAVDAFSACLRKHAPTNALELLELGRGVFWSQLTQLRSPFHDVTVFRLAGQTLADEFMWLTSLIHNPFSSPDQAQHDRTGHFNIQLQQVVKDIRHLPGLSRFLLPPLFVDLQLAASRGPVIVVNASEYGCDALVVLLDQDPVHIPLEITKAHVRALSSKLRTLTLHAKRVNVTRDLGVILRELWDRVVSPIVDFLQTTHPSQSRIWWCPTAEFALLPLHAAGPYRKGQQNLDDLYISSYTTTLTALIRARRRYALSPATERKRIQVVAIGQAHPTGESKLVSVRTEMASVARRFEDTTTFTRLEGPESYLSRVTEELSKNQWFHIACHGLSNPKQPFESAFALCDGHLTLQRIVQCDLEHPQFAYLSACHTTVGDEESSDEVIHVASAMQFAGFRSVIGTMGAVDDAQANKIASTFYDNMTDGSGRLDPTGAAFALHKTMKNLVDIPLDQRILYIHLGI